MKKIKVTVTNGKPTISAEGFVGDECNRATEKLELLLAGEGGVDVRDTRPDAERIRDTAD
jgi:hypothetical protein